MPDQLVCAPSGVVDPGAGGFCEAQIALALTGDRRALAALGSMVQPLFRRIAQRALGSGLAGHGQNNLCADDLVAELFVLLLDKGGRALRRWRQDGGRGLPQFLYYFAWHNVRTVLRSHRRHTVRVVPMDAAPPLFAADRAAEVERGWLLLAVLRHIQAQSSPERWRFFVKCFVEGKSFLALRDEYPNLTKGAYYQRVRRLRAQLRQARRELGGG